MDVVFIVILNAVWRHLVAMHAHVIPSFRWRILKSSMEAVQSYLFTVKHLDVLYDAAVLLQDGDGLGQRHPWTRVRVSQRLPPQQQQKQQ